MSKRTTSNSSPDSPAPRRRSAAPAPEGTSAPQPKPRARKKAAAPAEVASADNRPAAEAAPVQRPMPTRDQIAVRAYYIAMEHGFSSDPVSNWLLAERELTSA